MHPTTILKLYTYLFIYFIFHNKDYTNIKLYKDVARGPQEMQGLYEEVPSTHNKHHQYTGNKKSKSFVLNDCNKKIEVIEFGREFQIFGP